MRKKDCAVRVKKGIFLSDKRVLISLLNPGSARLQLTLGGHGGCAVCPPTGLPSGLPSGVTSPRFLSGSVFFVLFCWPKNFFELRTPEKEEERMFSSSFPASRQLKKEESSSSNPQIRKGRNRLKAKDICD